MEVYDSKDNSVLDNVYKLSAGEEISQTKPFRALVPGFEIWDCTFKLILDDRFVETYIQIQPWNIAETGQYSDGQPISVGETTV